MAPARARTAGSTTSGGWENYSVVGEHICIANWFWNNFIKIANEISF
jgi:hypothetical protein